MNNYSYSEIKTCIIKWYKELLLNFEDKYKFFISKNKKDVLIIDFEFPECLAQLTVNNSDYLPYKYVYFESLSLNTGRQIYCFFDDETTRKRDVITSLNNAFKFCEMYSTNKVESYSCDKKNLSHMVLQGRSDL